MTVIAMVYNDSSVASSNCIKDETRFFFYLLGVAHSYNSILSLENSDFLYHNMINETVMLICFEIIRRPIFTHSLKFFCTISLN